MEDLLLQIDQELSAPVLTPQQQLLSQRRITPDTPVQPHRFLMNYHGVSFLPRGELVAIGGKAKQGKTFLTSILMAVAVRSDTVPLLDITRTEAPPLRVLWVDTEQSEDSMQEILCGRIIKLAGGNSPDIFTENDVADRISCFSLRRDNWQDRWALVVTAIRQEKPDMVVLDGVRDMIGDINDYEQAQNMLDRLLQQASDTQACILCVLHENKAIDDHNLRGAIGTELTNKAFEIYTCKKDPEQYFFQVAQTATRKNEIREKIYFTVGNDGLPVLYAHDTQAATAADSLPALQPYYYRNAEGKIRLDFTRLFAAILSGGKTLSEDEILASAHAMGVHLRADKLHLLLGYAIDRHVLLQEATPQGSFCYRIACA